MEFNYTYQKDSLVNNTASRTHMSFAPDTRRRPTFFRGELKQSLAFRESISALHDVVLSDLRWKPKDRSEYKAWLERQEQVDWAAVAAQQTKVAQQLAQLRGELESLNRNHLNRMRSFYTARQKYFDYIFTRDKNAWYVLDPVITVHPDELFFECFSRDESSYGRLGVGYDVFQNVGEFECGTTNIDYSEQLYDEFQKIRSYKTTQFEIDPSGFEVQTSASAAYKEVKIDVPDSWVRGFLQVSSAMSLPAVRFELHPMDVHNICFLLRRRREIKGPRALRYQLRPGEPVRVILEPWNTVLDCPRSIFTGDAEEEIRVWGRRRIHILERLIPVARRFTVQLLGNGLPSFYMADLGDMSFTLGLSGWTANDWSAAGQFDLLAPRADVDSVTQQRVFEALRENWYEAPDSLAQRLGLDRATVLGALAAWTQAGRAMWDPRQQVYRVRELTQDPLPIDQLRFANEREQSATRFIDDNLVKIRSDFTTNEDVRVLEGSVRGARKKFLPELRLDADQRMISGTCTCNWHNQNQLRKGPCEHLLALRLKAARENRPARLMSLFGARS